jgi:hypothetical protein
MPWGHNPVMVRLGIDEPGADLTHHLQEGINMEANSERLTPVPRSGGRSWLTWGLLVHLLAGALVIAPALLPVPAEAVEIGLFFTEGVTPEDRETARQAIAATVKYFETNYQLGLKCDVRIVLVKGTPAFASALKRHCVISAKDSEVEAIKDTAGVSCAKEGAEKILIDVEYVPKALLMRNVSHEIVHKFIKQESGSSFDKIYWLSEGAANVIGAYVAESGGVLVQEARQSTCLKAIRAQRKFPSLTVLHSYEEWEAAAKKYGSTNTYYLAELAVFELAKRKSYKSLFQYFRYLKRYNKAQAFEMAFGMKLSEYENFFNQLLALML